MNRILFYVHAVSLILAYSLFGASYLILNRVTHVETKEIAIAWTVIALAATSTFTGFGLMARRSGPSESVGIGVSTVAAFLLLLLVL